MRLPAYKSMGPAGQQNKRAGGTALVGCRSCKCSCLLATLLLSFVRGNSTDKPPVINHCAALLVKCKLPWCSMRHENKPCWDACTSYCYAASTFVFAVAKLWNSNSGTLESPLPCTYAKTGLACKGIHFLLLLKPVHEVLARVLCCRETRHMLLP